jgi:hypothetical protein
MHPGEMDMKNRGVVQFVISAAVVVVLFPLLAIGALIGAHFLFGMTGMTGMFSHMGGMQAVVLGWAFLAFAVVGGLVLLLAGDIVHT